MTPDKMNVVVGSGVAAEFPFTGSPETTLGVELELQVIDPATGDLVPGAQRVLDACAEEGLEGVDGEFLLSMLEVKTGICRGVAEVRQQLFPLLRRVRAIAATLGFEVAIGGTHPFSRPNMSAISPDERYQRIRKRQGWLAYHEAIFGLHCHVGVPGGDEAVGVIDAVVEYLPHLLALSANSPFWQGVDTSFASARAALFRPSPHAGLPQHCSCWEDCCVYLSTMRAGGALDSMKDVYWDIRPRPDLGTVELRICDAPTSLSHLLGLAALTRALVRDALERFRGEPGLRRGDPRRFWLAAENKWRAARYGLEARCVSRVGRGPARLADDVADLLERLRGVAGAAGDGCFLSALSEAGGFEPGADRQRRIYRQTGDWRAVVADMTSRWARELDNTCAGPPDEAAPVHGLDIPLADTASRTTSGTSAAMRGPV